MLVMLNSSAVIFYSWPGLDLSVNQDVWSVSFPSLLYHIFSAQDSHCSSGCESLERLAWSYLSTVKGLDIMESGCCKELSSNTVPKYHLHRECVAYRACLLPLFRFGNQ
ncbi:hypothetical protein BsWGS_16868 [Bradybaena similaris]